MPVSIGGSPIYGSQFPCPQDTELVTGAGMQLVAGPLADRTTYLKAITQGAHIDGLNVHHINALSFAYPSELIVTRSVTSAPFYDADKWRPFGDGTAVINNKVDSGGPSISATAAFPIRLPHGCSLKSMTVYCKSAETPLPLMSNRMRWKLVRRNGVNSPTDVISTVYDSSPNVAAYNAPHAITSVPSIGMDQILASYDYWLVFTSDQSTDSASDGVTIYGISASIGISQIYNF